MQQKDKEKKKRKTVTFSWALKNIVWPRRGPLFLGFLLILIGRAAGLVAPWSLKELIDEVVPSGDITAVSKLIIIVGISIIVNAVASFIVTRVLSVQSHKVIYQLRIQLQKKVLSLPISYFDNTKSGALVSRIMSDVEGVRNLVGTGFVQLFGGTFTIITTMVLLIKMNAAMTGFVFIPVIVFGVIALKAFGLIRPIFRERGKINADVQGRLTETLNGVRVIKGFNAEEQETKVFSKGAFKVYDNVKKSLTATSLVQSSSTLLLGIASAGIMWIGGYYIIEGDMKNGEFMAFNALIAFMLAPIFQMSNIGSQLTEALAGLDRTQEIMEMPEEDNPEIRTETISKIKGEIKFENVSFSYEEGKEVIHNIDIHAPAGSVTALVGSSGSGKSTIAGMVSTFLNPSDGKITIDGNDLSKVSLKSYRQFLGVVLQDDFLFEGTIKENILFPRPQATEEELIEAVKGAYVNEFTDRFEEGLETIIGERGVKLSGGQKQRISIARALLAKPQIIILDEATSNLDTESELFIQKSLDVLMKNRTTFVIAHRLSTIRQADQILVIEEGKIAEQGKHDELIEKKGRYHDLYTYQSRI